MRPKRLTPLAARAIEFRDKVEASTEHVQALKKQLEQGGEDYADAANQCEVIEKEFDRLSDMFVDLSVLILKADKVKEYQPIKPPDKLAGIDTTTKPKVQGNQ